MKKKLLTKRFLPLLLTLSVVFSNLNAQVTIGSNEPPNHGAILDLKEEQTTGGEPNSTRGLGLPRVKITDKYLLKDVIEEYESFSDEDKEKLSTSHPPIHLAHLYNK